jgi:hypothetical protein
MSFAEEFWTVGQLWESPTPVLHRVWHNLCFYLSSGMTFKAALECTVVRVRPWQNRRAIMSQIDSAVQESTKIARCPYCDKETAITRPRDYAPVYAYCGLCGKKFIVERLANRIDVMTIEDAPSCSDPDRREIEMGGSDEQ